MFGGACVNALIEPNGSNPGNDAALARQRETDLLMCSMPEINPPLAQPCRLPAGGRRVNLVIPALSQKASFAGMVTAQRLFRRLLEHFDFARILVTHEAFEPATLEQWPGWTVGGELSRRQIVFLGRQSEATITVAGDDFFIATSWHAVMFIRSVQSQQKTLLRAQPRRYVYLIQEYEPLFYPASPQYCLAEASYENPDDMIAVFNTKALAEYFARRGFSFPRHFIHEPMLHPTLAELRLTHREICKERLIFIYARPAFMRNGFRLLVEGMKQWARTCPQAAQWSIVSAGGKHPNLYLSQDLVVRALHKLTLENYASLLSRTWVGLSLSFSAHPGQVAQEVAEFRAWSITNACETRKPAALAPNMVALPELSPRGIATALSTCCARFQPGRTSVIDSEHRIFRPAGEEFEFIEGLISEWKRLPRE